MLLDTQNCVRTPQEGRKTTFPALSACFNWFSCRFSLFCKMLQHRWRITVEYHWSQSRLLRRTIRLKAAPLAAAWDPLVPIVPPHLHPHPTIPYCSMPSSPEQSTRFEARYLFSIVICSLHISTSSSFCLYHPTKSLFSFLPFFVYVS